MLDSDKCIIITGNGRSGSNWLLDILDANPNTHCRNEPHSINNSPMNYIASLDSPEKANELLPDIWDKSVALSRCRMGERDHRITNPKQYVHPWSQKVGLTSLIRRPKVLRTLKAISPKYKPGEWSMPWWIGDQNELANTIVVLKIINLYPWIISWILTNKPETPVIHIVRYPGGQINSFLDRYANRSDEAEYKQQENHRKNVLKAIVKAYPQYQDVFGDIDSLSWVESIARYWRANNELIFQTGQNLSNYKRVIYEELADDPLRVAKDIYTFCDLPWSQSTEDIIREGLGNSVFGKVDGGPQAVVSKWKAKLPEEYHGLVSEILTDSFMNSWW
jgi:hypothetical protein